MIPASFDRWEMGGLEKLEKIRSGLADPLRGNLAGGVGYGHGALLICDGRPHIAITGSTHQIP
jgi:hypothetical protein